MHHPDLVEVYLFQTAAKLSGQWSELDRLRRAVEAAERRSEPHSKSESTPGSPATWEARRCDGREARVVARKSDAARSRFACEAHDLRELRPSFARETVCRSRSPQRNRFLQRL
jgi:hypothetical protein